MIAPVSYFLETLGTQNPCPSCASWRGKILPGKLGRAEGGGEVGNEQDEEGDKDRNDTANG
jgi:hypothetical protein